MYRYSCNLCEYFEDRAEASKHIPRCPECDKRGKWGSLYRKKLRPKKIRLDHIGFCSRCGKSVGVNSGEVINGAFYGPECAKTVYAPKEGEK
jgi:hypothetical protein